MTGLLRRLRRAVPSGPATAPAARPAMPESAPSQRLRMPARAAAVDGTGSPEPSMQELRDLAAHARDRLALYQRRMYLGRGEPARLAELQRISAGAAARLRRARDSERPPPGERRDA